jgi:hypothetical protein
MNLTAVNGANVATVANVASIADVANLAYVICQMMMTYIIESMWYIKAIDV